MDEIGDNDKDDDESSEIEDNLSVSDNEADSVLRTSSPNPEKTTTESSSGNKGANVARIAPHSSVVDLNEWKIECERVAPKLRSNQRRTNSEWRQRVHQASDSASKVDSILSLSQTDLNAISRYVAYTQNKYFILINNHSI